MTRYRATARDRYAALTVSLVLAAAVITGVVILLHKIAAHVQHAVQQAPTQQDTGASVRLHDMLVVAGALAQSPLIWGLGLCAAGALVIERNLHHD